MNRFLKRLVAIIESLGLRSKFDAKELTKEDQAATAINGVTAGVTAVLQPDLNK